MSTRIFLIRHGVTNWNKKKRYCGRLNVSISREGKEQSVKLRNRIHDVCFDKVYCSVKKRALETCRIIFGESKFTKVTALKEINFGVLEGMRYPEIMHKYGLVYENWINDPHRHRLPKSEPIMVFKKRVVTAINKIVRDNAGKTVAVVCHGGVIGVLMSSFKKSRDFWRYVPKAASITIIEYKKGKPRIKKFNDIKHLE
jgi:broad specificity phosphatase PhoE